MFYIIGLKKKINDYPEFKVHLIQRKQVAPLHSTVLILCDEGAGLVAVCFSRDKEILSP